MVGRWGQDWAQDCRVVTVWHWGLGQSHDPLALHPSNVCWFCGQRSACLSHRWEFRGPAYTYRHHTPGSHPDASPCPPAAPSHPPGQACPALISPGLVSMETVGLLDSDSVVLDPARMACSMHAPTCGTGTHHTSQGNVGSRSWLYHGLWPFIVTTQRS